MLKKKKLNLEYQVRMELGIDDIRENLLKFTRKAYVLLPKRKNPKILDIGCGTGVETMELYNLSKGNIVAIDIDEQALAILKSKTEEIGLGGNIEVKKMSLLEMDFPIESFDIIWAEGVLQFIGFENAIQDWKDILKHGGNLVLHDDDKDVPMKLNIAEQNGYKVLNYFYLPEDEWWDEYYSILDKHLLEARQKFSADHKYWDELKKHQDMVNAVKHNVEDFRSVFILLEKK